MSRIVTTIPYLPRLHPLIKNPTGKAFLSGRRPLISNLVERQAATTSALPCQLDFTDHRTVFQHKSFIELLRSLVILKVCSFNKFVDNALPLMRFGEKYLGERIFSSIARPTFYRQFVGGDTEEELKRTSATLAKAGIRLMVCPAMEEDAGEGGGAEDKYDFNTEYITEIGRMMVRSGAVKPCLQFKITAMMPADIVVQMTSMLGEGSISLDEMADKVKHLPPPLISTQVAASIETGEQVALPGFTVEEVGVLTRGVARLARSRERKTLTDIVI